MSPTPLGTSNPHDPVASRSRERLSAGFPATVRSAIVLAGGAVVYGGVSAAGVLPFRATPAAIGVVVIAAGLVGRSRHLLPNGAVLLGWGAGVLVAADLAPAGREAPLYLLGVACGVLAARVWSRPDERSAWFAAAATAAVAGGASFSLAYEVSWVGRWPTWAASIAAWAAVEAVRVQRSAGAAHG